ncbi:hypothetical protein OH76DRAFT_1409733 [Lentinus brumalis]|uniref:Uncharacterized protein n=1 Tax=Lentinus brumalis TaxID=2498619 RepID=A0A371CU02_9APHY|nr:hypothetical protein OH76DRAFT_1409733 [Polyporus brumalis]
MGLSDKPQKYKAIRDCVRELVRGAMIDYNVHWNQQPKRKIVSIFDVARQRHPYLKRFAHDWATEDIAKAHIRRVRYWRNRQKKEAEADGDDEDGSSGSGGSAPGSDNEGSNGASRGAKDGTDDVPEDDEDDNDHP